jgi:methylmalonyl-CoA mutase cobalamin-binding subunit
MTMLRIIGAVALLIVGGELPALAQAAVQEPGAYAFYHPNADVLNAFQPLVRSIYPMSAFASSAFYPRLRTLSRHHRK